MLLPGPLVATQLAPGVVAGARRTARGGGGHRADRRRRRSWSGWPRPTSSAGATATDAGMRARSPVDPLTAPVHRLPAATGCTAGRAPDLRRGRPEAAAGCAARRRSSPPPNSSAAPPARARWPCNTPGRASSSGSRSAPSRRSASVRADAGAGRSGPRGGLRGRRHRRPGGHRGGPAARRRGRRARRPRLSPGARRHGLHLGGGRPSAPEAGLGARRTVAGGGTRSEEELGGRSGGRRRCDRRRGCAADGRDVGCRGSWQSGITER